MIGRQVVNTQERFENIERRLADQKRKVRFFTGLAPLALGLAAGSIQGEGL
jgi:hypothetical protein